MKSTRLGGEMNAFTTRETTTFYVKVLDQQLQQALELLADLFHHSRFDSKEIEKEKQVVLEEIRMVQDDPEDLVQELHTGQVLGRHPLGRSILGHEETIQSLKRPGSLGLHRCALRSQPDRDCHCRQFRAGRWIGWSHGIFGKKKPLNGLSRPERRPPEVHGGVLVKRKPLEQVHLCLGLKGVAAGHQDRYAAYALNSVLGGSMSSRLFQEIREKRGLAYSIYSFLSGYSDIGTITVYAATRPKEVERVVDLVCREITRISKQRH